MVPPRQEARFHGKRVRAVAGVGLRPQPPLAPPRATGPRRTEALPGRPQRPGDQREVTPEDGDRVWSNEQVDSRSKVLAVARDQLFHALP